MEKVKDFLYDISDFVFSLLIIAIIFFVVSFKLTDTMQVHFFSNLGRDTAVDMTDATQPSLDDLDGEVVTTPEVTPVEEETLPEETVTDPVEETPVVVEIKEVEFEIAPGSPGFKIATNLESAGLIDDVDVFIQTLDDLNLGNKLRAGTFKLNTGMTVEEIIKALAGQ
ncbi:endolytic transglycosylase MltG [Acidaminobacter sp. JC074]|uniref:endolytic transglycosylase MltG n=1 Tax=Acidaminobacter sp. JC074 TaxID=2530199 RepID=UPI001F0E903C|nr:endolytic transglycosylase MltG [Acidaminobacter sp. JC074]MCH4890386.1 endolytic transglycosylase MltG [Acidaminobacter sp. JC074]